MRKQEEQVRQKQEEEEQDKLKKHEMMLKEMEAVKQVHILFLILFLFEIDKSSSHRLHCCFSDLVQPCDLVAELHSNKPKLSCMTIWFAYFC